MILKILGSGSKGNCYIFRASSGKSLILEAGIPWRTVKEAMDFRLNDIELCLISHIHGDHAAYAKDFLMACVSVGTTAETFNSAKAWPNRTLQKVIKPNVRYRFGEFTVFALTVMHDVPCVGYVISHAEMGRLAFFTDCVTVPYRLTGINHWLIEANYSDEILERNILGGAVPPSTKERLLHSHMEISTTEKVLRANDLSKVKDVTLVHLSDRNSDAGLFRQRIQEVTGLPTYIAEGGTEIDLTN